MAMSVGLWMQSRLCEPLCQVRFVTVQVGRGQPGGGSIEAEDVGRERIPIAMRMFILSDGGVECG